MADNPVIKKSDLDLALARIRAEGGGGGGGGTSNYNDLSNKPSINSVTLSGNKTSADLGLANSSDVITAITFNGNPVTVANNTAAIQSVGDVQDVRINKSSIVSNGVADIPYAGGNQFGVIAIDVTNEPGSKYVKISYDDPLHPAGQPSHSQDVYLPLLPSANSPFPYWYLPDATHTQKGAITLNEWEGTFTDSIDEVGGQGYDPTVGGIARIVTTTSGDFSLTVGNRVLLHNVSFWGRTEGYAHYINVDGTGYKEVVYAPSTSVSSNNYEALIRGDVEVIYDGTNYVVIGGYAFKRPVTPQASENQSGTVKVDWNNDPGAGWVKITTSNGYHYLPYLFFTQSSSAYPTTQTIRAKWLPDATSSVKGAVIVDNTMSDSSTNPVQNSVVKAYIDSHAGGGGVTDVTVNGSSVVSNNVAVITVPDEAQSISYDDTNNNVLQGQDVQDVIDGIDWLFDTMSMPANPSQNGRYFHTVTRSTGSSNVYAWITLDASDIPVDDTNFTEISAQDVQTAIEELDDNIGHLWYDVAQTIDNVKINGTALTKTNKSVNITVASQITAGGTDPVNSTAVIDYINSLDATNTSY